MIPLADVTPTLVPGTVTINSWAVAIIALLHIQIATFITGTSFIATIGEAIAMFRDDPRQDRAVHGQVKAIAYIFSFGSASAILFIITILTGLWGRFFVALQQITFWVFFFEAITFFGEVTLTYILYANWDRLRRFRRARFALLVLLTAVTWWQMFFIDVVASFMLSPGTGDISQLHQLLNPTEIPLTLHRTLGNIAWAGAALAFYAAFMGLRERRRERRAGLARVAPAPAHSVGAMSLEEHPGGALLREREAQGAGYFDWLGQWGACYAIGFSLLQPWVGYSYAKEIQLHSYLSWYRMMFGDVSAVFLLQIFLLGMIFILGTAYFRSRLRAAGIRSRTISVCLLLLVLATLLAALPYHLAWTYADVVNAGQNQYVWDGGRINPLGAFIPYKVSALVVIMLAGLVALVVFVRARAEERIGPAQATRRSQWMLLALGLCVSVMMIVMGYIREHSRGPYLIFGELQINQQAPANPGELNSSAGPVP